MPEAVKVICVLDSGEYPAGCLPPEGYCEWHEWARQQHRAGLRQMPCPKCGKWRFPQESCCGLPPRMEPKSCPKP